MLLLQEGACPVQLRSCATACATVCVITGATACAAAQRIANAHAMLEKKAAHCSAGHE